VHRKRWRRYASGRLQQETGDQKAFHAGLGFSFLLFIWDTRWHFGTEQSYWNQEISAGIIVNCFFFCCFNRGSLGQVAPELQSFSNARVLLIKFWMRSIASRYFHWRKQGHFQPKILKGPLSWKILHYRVLDTQVLKNISFTVGQFSVALVGQWIWKSTIINF
jgi:hypothetical protein